MSHNSRIPGFYRLSLDQRRRLAAELLDMPLDQLEGALQHGGLASDQADKLVENVVGTYTLPLALALNVRLNGRDHLVPMAIEEPSVVAAASNAAKMIRLGGGFVGEADPPLMIGQIQLDGVDDPAKAERRLLEHRAELMQLGDRAVPTLVGHGGGVRSIEVRDLGDGMVVVHVLVDCCDAMGANLVNTVAEQLAASVAKLIGGRMGLRILSNLSDRRRVRIKGRVPARSLQSKLHSGQAVRERIVQASRFAERDPYRAATHNKGIMNGIDAVVIATGNDWRAIEAGAHAYAARSGRYLPLCTWEVAETGELEGTLELPLSLGTVGGPNRVHQAAQLALRLVRARSATELAMVAAAAGMASNLAALKALATEGIQRGHMMLHARSVASAAGATGADVERIASAIHAAGRITIEAARQALLQGVGTAAPISAASSNPG